MYSTSLLYNFRLVELDCYNGEGDNIIITHGYSFVTELNLEDILYELKDAAFINSDLPVILSIENHLDERHQIILANKFKEILEDLYIFPYDSKPEYVPTLREMRNKFLVKCGGRKLWEKEKINKKPPQNESLNNEINIKKKNIRHYKYKHCHSLNLVEKKIIVLDKRADYKLKMIKNKKKNFRNISYTFNEKTPIIFDTITSLENVRGVLATRLKKEKIDSNYYKPWEMISLKSTKTLKYYNDNEKNKKMLNLTKQCSIKVYPDSFDSSNYNMIKCFSCGIQACALNLQATEDDFILYDKIFFKQSQGLGYVVKYDKFFSKDYINSYEKPRFICHMEILSIINCSNLIENAKLVITNNGLLKLKIYSIGVKEDEKNPIVKCKLLNGTMFPIFENGNPTINYEVYDYELSAIMIKIKYNKKMIGRACIPYNLMKQGLRRIPVYDNHCFCNDDVYMVGCFSLKAV